VTVDNKPVAKAHIRLREESDNWALLFDPDTGNHRVINPVGVFVWKLLDGNHNLEGIVKEVGDFYNNVPKDVEQHVTKFIEVLVEKGYVETNSEGTVAS
jgi:SynChlorMet cassette protein ScmD